MVQWQGRRTTDLMIDPITCPYSLNTQFEPNRHRFSLRHRGGENGAWDALTGQQIPGQ